MSDLGLPDPEGDVGRLAAFLRVARASTFARDAGVLAISQIVGISVGAVQGIAVARILGPRSYGMVALIVGVPTIVYVFFDIRSEDVAVRYLGEFANSGRSEEALAFYRLTILADLCVGAVALVVVAALSPWAATHVAGDPEAALLLVVFAAGMACHAPAIGSGAVLLTLGRYRTLAKISILVALVRAAMVLGLVAGGFGVAGAVIGSALAQAAEGALLLTMGTRHSGQAWDGSWVRARSASLRSRYREILKFLFWSDLGSLLGLITKQLDVVLVGFFGGPTQAGYYRLAKSVGSLPGVVISPLQNVTYQRFSRLRTTGADDLRKALRRVVMLVALPLSALTVLLVPFVPFALRIVAGPRYTPAAVAAQALVALSAVWMLTLWLKPIALTLHEVHAWALAAGVTAGLSLAGFLLLTPSFGFQGTAWARFAAVTLGQIILVLYLLRRHGSSMFPGPVVQVSGG